MPLRVLCGLLFQNWTVLVAAPPRRLTALPNGPRVGRNAQPDQPPVGAPFGGERLWLRRQPRQGLCFLLFKIWMLWLRPEAAPS